MATYLFLSDDWLDEARAIRAEYEGRGGTIEHAVRMNLVVVEVPFGEGAVHAHADTCTGELVLDVGHIDPVDLKVTIGYDIARALLVEGNPQAGLQAFMQGKIKVEGDIAKLMALQSASPDPTGRRDRRPDPGHHRVAATGAGQPDACLVGGHLDRGRPLAPGRVLDEEAAHHRAEGHQGADQVGGVERGQVPAPPWDEAWTVTMTWMPATIPIWVISSWAALITPSSSAATSLAADEAVDGVDTPLPRPERARATMISTTDGSAPDLGEHQHRHEQGAGAGHDRPPLPHLDRGVAGDGRRQREHQRPGRRQQAGAGLAVAVDALHEDGEQEEPAHVGEVDEGPGTEGETKFRFRKYRSGMSGRGARALVEDEDDAEARLTRRTGPASSGEVNPQDGATLRASRPRVTEPTG